MRCIQCIDLQHRVAVANRLALATKPLVDDLRRNFPQHPAVLAFDDYSDVAISSTIRAALAAADDPLTPTIRSHGAGGYTIDDAEEHRR